MIELRELRFLAIRDRAAISPGRKLHQFFQLFGSRVLQVFFKRFRSEFEGFSHTLEILDEFLGLILRDETDEERQVLVLGYRPIADEPMVLPESVDFPACFIVEEEPFERFIFPMIKFEADDLIERNDMRIANV